MRKNGSTRARKPASSSRLLTPPAVPDPTAFTFSSILDSLGSEGEAALEAIAEICGKSNLSLAEEHNMHLPPHAEVSGLEIARLIVEEEEEEEREGAGVGGQREGMQTRSLSKRRAERKSGAATTTTTTNPAPALTTTVHARGQKRGTGVPVGNVGAVSQILAWLRGAGSCPEDDGAMRNLRGLLDERAAVRLGVGMRDSRCERAGRFPSKRGLKRLYEYQAWRLKARLKKIGLERQ
ncbi:MAG: hypothetical protein Q9163_005850 [Psora crenata]